MTSTIKAEIAPVPVGHLQIEGLMSESGVFYVGVPQIVERFTIDTKQPTRYFKSLMGNDLQFAKVSICGTRLTVNAVSLQVFEKLVLAIATSGNVKALEFLGLPSGVTKRLPSDPCKHLYVFATEDGLYIKIGIAKDPLKRLQIIQIGCPCRLRIVFSKLCRNARQVEQRLHLKLSDYQTNGEWFDSSSFSLVDWRSL